MSNQHPILTLVIRLATSEDITLIDYLDSFSRSPTRHIHRDLHKYFGSVDPSTHERTLIFLVEVDGSAVGKAELMLPPQDTINAIGYIKRVIIHPDFQGQGLAQQLLMYIITCARSEYKLAALDLHVWEQNHAAIHLYESSASNSNTANSTIS